VPTDPVASLISDVDALVAHLEWVNERWWAQRFRLARTDLANRDAHGINRILGAYGGMGSFNDLVIHPRNGHTIDPGQINLANETLNALRAGIYGKAAEVRHQQRG
jgi:hypothetical protein